MQKKLLELKRKFNDIKSQGLHKSVCRGSAGIGQTFERLLGKSSDTSPSPDYYGIEIKAKHGYSKTPLSLFTLVPKSDDGKQLDFLVNNYGYPESSFSEYKVLRANVSAIEDSLVGKKFLFNLEIDRSLKRAILVIKDKYGNILNREFYWEFECLKDRLIGKLSYLALVVGYPYRREQSIYYKYFRMSLYKLRNFDVFIELLEEGIITVNFNIGICKDIECYGKIKDRGTAFKIECKNLYKLFESINI